MSQEQQLCLRVRCKRFLIRVEHGVVRGRARLDQMRASLWRQRRQSRLQHDVKDITEQSRLGDASVLDRLERVLARQDDDGRVEPDAMVTAAVAALVHAVAW